MIVIYYDVWGPHKPEHVLYQPHEKNIIVIYTTPCGAHTSQNTCYQPHGKNIIVMYCDMFGLHHSVETSVVFVLTVVGSTPCTQVGLHRPNYVSSSAREEYNNDILRIFLKEKPKQYYLIATFYTKMTCITHKSTQLTTVDQIRDLIYVVSIQYFLPDVVHGQIESNQSSIYNSATQASRRA